MRLSRFVSTLAPLVLLGTSGCLATQGNIRLLQDEMRATRSQLAANDSAIMRAEEARRAQIATLGATLDRLGDTVRVLTARFAQFQANASGEFDAMGRQIVTVQALLGQTTKGVQEARAQLEALREQGIAPPAASPGTSGAAAPDTSRGSSGPGPATLFTSSFQQLKEGNNRTARAGFDELLKTYPTYDDAPHAQAFVGDTYRNEGNIAAADSVYQLVYTKYPTSPFAAYALYKRGVILWDADKKAEARILFNRIIREFPRSAEADLANSKIRPE